jgi:hypothetical protein
VFHLYIPAVAISPHHQDFLGNRKIATWIMACSHGRVEAGIMVGKVFATVLFNLTPHKLSSQSVAVVMVLMSTAGLLAYYNYLPHYTKASNAIQMGTMGSVAVGSLLLFVALRRPFAAQRGQNGVIHVSTMSLTVWSPTPG